MATDSSGFKKAVWYALKNQDEDKSEWQAANLFLTLPSTPQWSPASPWNTWCQIGLLCEEDKDSVDKRLTGQQLSGYMISKYI